MAIYNWKASDFTVGSQPTAWVAAQSVTSFLIQNDGGENYLDFVGAGGGHSLLHFVPAGSLTDFEIRIRHIALGGNEGATGRSNGSTTFLRAGGDLKVAETKDGSYVGIVSQSSLSTDGSERWSVYQFIGANVKTLRYSPGESIPVAWYQETENIATVLSAGNTGLWSFDDPATVYEFEVRTGSDMKGVEAAPEPAVTTTDTLQPGEEFTLTATNYASAPVSPATITDSEGSTITVPVTISGSGPYTAVGTMPTLAEAVTAGTSLLFGDVTIELST